MEEVTSGESFRRRTGRRDRRAAGTSCGGEKSLDASPATSCKRHMTLRGWTKVM
ncbi:hypothetical protein GDO81_024950 [Engystomops pustulosus]|uniref:Uncharacterized protein n=1 Tax=Engystomops pustulosus TaxID=76066 RepID=A0AAV6YM66_ENGPU|nr:hypothetical protein GDO81_024950 [Engystomops pustulosus]